MTNGTYQRILVPIDGSRATPVVMEKAIAATKKHQAHLDILNVAQVNQLTDGYAIASSLSTSQTFDLVKTTQERLGDLKKHAEESGVKSVAIHIRFGNPKQVIARDFIADHHNDLIVIGTTGLSMVERLIVGSVTSYVVRNAACDVEVVRV